MRSCKIPRRCHTKVTTRSAGLLCVAILVACRATCLAQETSALQHDDLYNSLIRFDGSEKGIQCQQGVDSRVAHIYTQIRNQLQNLQEDRKHQPLHIYMSGDSSFPQQNILCSKLQPGFRNDRASTLAGRRLVGHEQDSFRAHDTRQPEELGRSARALFSQDLQQTPNNGLRTRNMLVVYGSQCAVQSPCSAHDYRYCSLCGHAVWLTARRCAPRHPDPLQTITAS